MRFTFAVLLFAALGCAAPVEPTDAPAGDGPDPVAQLERAGAKLTRDEATPGKPVVGVSLPGIGKKVSDDDLLPLVSLPTVKDLSLFGCDKITAAGLKHVAALKKLEKLGLSNTALDDAALTELKGLTELRELHLTGSVRFTDKCAATINAFAELRNLSLPSSFTGVGVRKLTALKKVRELYLGGITSLTDTEIKFLAETMPELEALEMGSFGIGTEITDDAIPHFAKMKKLQKLGIAGSQLTPAGLKKLREALPNCTVTKPEPKFERPPVLGVPKQ